MAVGWSRDGAVQEQIDATVESAVQLARSRLPDGESSTLHYIQGWCGTLPFDATRRSSF